MNIPASPLIAKQRAAREALPRKGTNQRPVLRTQRIRQTTMSAALGWPGSHQGGPLLSVPVRWPIAANIAPIFHDF